MIESYVFYLYFFVLFDYLGYFGLFYMIDEYKKEMSIVFDLKNFGSWMMDEFGSRVIY